MSSDALRTDNVSSPAKQLQTPPGSVMPSSTTLCSNPSTTGLLTSILTQPSVLASNRGGDIQNPIFKKILSIGYELETSNLSKFTLLKDSDNVLVNTDTAGQDLERLYKQIAKIKNNGGTSKGMEKGSEKEREASSLMSEEEADDFQRRQEIFEVNAYTTKSGKGGVLKKEPNSSMIVANDMAVTPISKHLKSVCKPHEDELVNVIMEAEEDAEYAEETAQAAAQEFKNQLYSFHTDSAKKYLLSFAMANKKDCGMFSKVEWIFTYYSPHHSGDIILDQFANVARNLTHHLDKLTEQSGKLVMNLTTKSRHIVPDPIKRKLFHLPGTNLHYMQTHFHDDQLTLDDICITPQMTFSCNVVDFIPIVRALVHDSFNINQDFTDTCTYYTNLMDNVVQCVDELFNEFTMISIDDEVIKQSLKNYLFLFLFKLYQYYNRYLQDEDVKVKSAKIMYLKDALFINSRHSNYALYVEIKKCFKKLVGDSASEEQIIQMIHQLILQPKIMNQHMQETHGNVRKNAFNLKNVLEKGHKNYGDPHYSLLSYLQFFEDPEEDNRIQDISENFRDWLYHNDLDVFSNTMDIKNGVVLAELRMFPRLMAVYLNSIANSKLFKQLANGACNRAVNRHNPYMNRFTIGALKQFVILYDEYQSKNKAQGQDQEPIKSRLTSHRMKKITSRRTTKKNSRSLSLPIPIKSRSL